MYKVHVEIKGRSTRKPVTLNLYTIRGAGNSRTYPFYISIFYETTLYSSRFNI